MRKVLTYGRAEWDALPWHDQKMYLDELAADLDGQRSGGPPDTIPAGPPTGQLPDPEPAAHLDEAAEEAPAAEPASTRPSWLTLPITETTFGEPDED